MTDVNILVCEPEPMVHQHLKDGFDRIFGLMGYSSSVRACTNIDKALEIIGSGNVDVLVSDLHFSIDQSIGLDFIRKVKKYFPQIFVLACSAESPSIEAVKNRTPSFDMFVSKRHLTTPSENEFIQISHELRAKFNKLTKFQLRFRGFTESELLVRGEPIDENEVRAILSQVYSDLELVHDRFHPRTLILERVTGGLSGSLVLFVEIEAKSARLRFVKTVIKISERDWARSERDNFNRFAKWILPYTTRTEFIGYGETAKFGAVGYAFAMGGEKPFASLGSYISQGDREKIESIVCKIFDRRQLNFYQNTRDQSDSTIGLHYRQRYFSDSQYELTQRRFRDTASRTLGAAYEKNGWVVAGEWYPDPFRVLFDRGDRKFHVAVCHGDLNANNVLCAEDEQVLFIDFQDTGPAHLFQDFAALEHSVRLEWGLPKKRFTNVKTLMSRELYLAARRVKPSSAQHYSGVCNLIRSRAEEQFPDIDHWEHLYAVCAIALKLTRLPNLTDIQLRRLIACVLASAKTIDGIWSDP